MNNMVKETIMHFKEAVESKNGPIKFDYTISINDVELLLDYITNLQEELEELREDNYAYHQLMKMQNEREYRSKFLKEFQEEFGKNVFPDYDEIYKRYDKLKKENKRLNNIIDGLEKEIKFQRKCSLGLKNGFGVSLCDIFLDKLNELKGDNK